MLVPLTCACITSILRRAKSSLICWVCYLAVQAHPPAVQSVLTQPGWPTEVVFPRGGIDHFQALISYSPVHTEVGCLSWLSCFSITYSCKKQKPPYSLMIFDLLQTQKYTGNPHICSVKAANRTVERKPFQEPSNSHHWAAVGSNWRTAAGRRCQRFSGTWLWRGGRRGTGCPGWCWRSREAL